MDTEGFRQFLQRRNIPEDKVEPFIFIADKFEGLLQGRKPDSSDVEIFAMRLIREGLNTWDHFIALARYGQFLGNNEVYREAIALLDGSEVLDNLHERLGVLVGERKRDEILAGIDLPPLGLPTSHKPRILQAVMERLEVMLDAETCDKLLSGSLRTLDDQPFLEDKEKYQACASLDEFLAQRGQDSIAQLEQLKSEGRLYFTQEVTDDAIAFVRRNPLISQGVREGNVLYQIKIPLHDQRIPDRDRRKDEALLLLPLPVGARVHQERRCPRLAQLLPVQRRLCQETVGSDLGAAFRGGSGRVNPHRRSMVQDRDLSSRLASDGKELLSHRMRGQARK